MGTASGTGTAVGLGFNSKTITQLGDIFQVISLGTTTYPLLADNNDLVFFTGATHKLLDVDDFYIEAEAITLIASVGTTANGFIKNVIVTDDPATTTYTANTDYTFDAMTGVVTALGGGAIGSTDDILVTYEYDTDNTRVEGVLLSVNLDNYMMKLTKDDGAQINLDEVGIDNLPTSVIGRSVVVEYLKRQGVLCL